MIPFEPVQTYFTWSTTTMFFRRRQVRTLHPIPGDDQVAITVDAASEVLGLVLTQP
jgi:hypothetical protein